MIEDAARELEAQWQARRPLERDRAHVLGRGRRRACAARVVVEHTLARLGAERLWELLARASSTSRALGALTGGQAVQMVRAGLEAIYLSGWQVAADANLAGADLPRPEPLPGEQRARRSSAASTTRCCAPTRSTGPRAERRPHWLAPIVADAEAGFGGPLNAFELMKCDDRGGRRRRPLRGPARLGEEVRPPRRQGARPDERSSSARSTRRGSPPTSAACRPCSSRAPTRSARRSSRATSTSATASS